MKKHLCIYHGNCADGFASAWVVRKALSDDDIEFYPGVYQRPPPDVAGRNVIIVDFSYKRSVMEKIVTEARSLLVLDHHKSAAEDLQGMIGGKAEIIFSMDKAGCMLTWEYFFPGVTPPQLLRHIEDRDLWRFALPGTREIQANIFSHPYDFEVWDKLMVRNPQELIAEGTAIERKHFKDMRELLDVVTRPLWIGGHKVPVANLPYTFVSDAAHWLATDSGAPFAGCYWDTPTGRVFGLRSTATGLDVSEIAKLYGGGGHRNAAGFTVSFDIAASFEERS